MVYIYAAHINELHLFSYRTTCNKMYCYNWFNQCRVAIQTNDGIIGDCLHHVSHKITKYNLGRSNIKWNILSSKCILSWRSHQREADFSALLTLCAGHSPVTGTFPSEKPSNADFAVSLAWVRISCWKNSRMSGNLTLLVHVTSS